MDLKVFTGTKARWACLLKGKGKRWGGKHLRKKVGSRQLKMGMDF